MSCDGPHLFNASYTPRLGFPGGSAVRNLPTNAEDSGDMDSILESGRSPGEGMTTYSNILAWEIPWTEEPDGLHPTGSQRVRHDLMTKNNP